MEGAWVLNDPVEHNPLYQAALEHSVNRRLSHYCIRPMEFGVFILIVSLPSLIFSHTWDEENLLKQPCLYSK